MAIVYQANDDSVFETDLIIVKEGVKYALDITNIDEIKSHRLKDLTTIGEGFDVIVRYLPDYSTNDEVGCLDDLDCLIDHEYDDEKLERLTLIWGSDPDHWVKERDKLYRELLNRAINNYKNQF